MSAQTQNQRQSRLPWLGELPSQWQVERARFIFQQEARPPRDDDGVVTAFRDGQVTLRENRRMGGFTMAIKETGYQGVRRGDLVIHTMDAFAGAIGVSESDGKCTGEYAVCNPVPDGFDNGYYAALLREMALKGYIYVICPSVRERAPRFRFARLKDVYFPVPPPSTQKAIAAFLDRKTAAIDALIEKKQKLLGLLAEKRAALINQAVTKGLDPDVPMKDSGVPWIGEIPAHWEVKRLKNVSSFVTSGPRGWGQYYSDAGPLFLRITNVARDGIDLLLSDDKQQCVSPPTGAEGVRTLAQEGDVLVTITADLGSVGVVPAGLGVAYISQHVALCRPTTGMASRLLAHMVRGPWGQIHYDLGMNGGTKVGLTLDDVRNTPVAVPPAKEQAGLLARLDSLLGQWEQTSKQLDQQIERLQEYRQSLITAAVTGQLNIPEEDN